MRPMRPMEPMRPLMDGADEANGADEADGATMQSTHALKVAPHKESCRLQLHVSRHLNPFHPAYMHKKWCRKIDANRQWHGGPPPV